MAKHARQLSTPPESDPDLDSARVFAQTFFGGFRCPKVFPALSSIEGSTKACVENSRQNGGAREFLRHLIAEYHGVTPDVESLVSMFNPNGSQVFEEKGLPPLSPEDWRILVRSFTPAVSRSYLPLPVQEILMEFFLDHPEAENFPTARVAEVLEPLKVRLITAMNAVRSHVSRPIQRALWKFLRSSPVFQLIGEPITEALIQDLVTRHLNRGGGEDPFVSGDYSAATDGLDIRLSKVFLEEFLNHLDEEDQPFRAEISSILYEQVIIYPPWTGIAPILQKNGQLMGSVLSFPILCLANLFAYIQSLPDRETVLRSRRLMDRLPVLINGDDILFRSSDAHYSKWLHEIGRVGFVPSVGKNFRHPRFFTVNSIPIEYRPASTPFQFWSKMSWADMEEFPAPWAISTVPSISIRGFLNVGLLTGQAKLTGRDTLGALPLSGWHAGAVLEALNPSQAHKWFLKYHRSTIQQQTRFGSTTLNIFAHPLLGGLGFTVPLGIEPRFSPEQRRLAQSLYLSASYSYEGQESDYSLKSLVFLESDFATPISSLGRLNRRVEVELYPFGTPLPEGYSPFVDTTGVQPLAMVHSPPLQDDEVTGLKARCRLSSNRLRQLTKRFGPDTVDLHPLDKMTEFPFTPVRVSRSTFVQVEGFNPHNASTFQERPFSKVYVQEIPFQDIATPVPELETDIKVSVPEDWESTNVVLAIVLPPIVEEKETPSPPKLVRQAATHSIPHDAQVRRLLQKERVLLNRGIIHRRSPAEEALFE
jgi:hypothetical protein